MRNFHQPGNSLTLPAPVGGIAAGDPYQLGQLFGVAANTAAQGDDFDLELDGVFELPKPAGEVWETGELLYWDPVNFVVTRAGGALLFIGAAPAPAAISDTVALVRLNSVAAALVEEQSLLLRTADDAGLAALNATLTPSDTGKLVLVASRSGQGPQLLHVEGSTTIPLIGLSATVSIELDEPSGVAVPIGVGQKLNLADAAGAGLRFGFPEGSWDFTDSELTFPANGYVRHALTVLFDFSGTAALTFALERWDGMAWVDAGRLIVQEVSQTITPYQLAGFRPFDVQAGQKYRLVVWHSANATRTLTVYYLSWVTNYVFSTIP